MLGFRLGERRLGRRGWGSCDEGVGFGRELLIGYDGLESRSWNWNGDGDGDRMLDYYDDGKKKYLCAIPNQRWQRPSLDDGPLHQPRLHLLSEGFSEVRCPPQVSPRSKANR